MKLHEIYCAKSMQNQGLESNPRVNRSIFAWINFMQTKIFLCEIRDYNTQFQKKFLKKR